MLCSRLAISLSKFKYNNLNFSRWLAALKINCKVSYKTSVVELIGFCKNWMTATNLWSITWNQRLIESLCWAGSFEWVNHTFKISIVLENVFRIEITSLIEIFTYFEMFLWEVIWSHTEWKIAFWDFFETSLQFFIDNIDRPIEMSLVLDQLKNHFAKLDKLIKCNNNITER